MYKNFLEPLADSVLVFFKLKILLFLNSLVTMMERMVALLCYNVVKGSYRSFGMSNIRFVRYLITINLVTLFNIFKL